MEVVVVGRNDNNGFPGVCLSRARSLKSFTPPLCEALFFDDLLDPRFCFCLNVFIGRTLIGRTLIGRTLIGRYTQLIILKGFGYTW